MTDAPADTRPRRGGGARGAARLRRRYAAERRFRLYGLVAILAAVAMLAVLIGSMALKGYTAFWQTEIALPVHFDAERIEPSGAGSYRAVLGRTLEARFPEAGRSDVRKLMGMMSSGAELTLRRMVREDLSIIGTTRRVWLTADDEIDMVRKGHIDPALPEDARPVSDKELAWLGDLQEAGDVRTVFNATFFTAGDSREPEQAGILGATVGSALTLLVTLLASFPMGVLAAVYLEEFAPKNRFTDLIEVNINNLAAVPSIVFGLLGLAVFLNFFGLPRSAPLVGGLVLALMTLPTIIIAARAALAAVPPSIREGALGIGASRLQTVTHHVLPLAMPGILTGTIIGLARALGETAPLLMIGMVAFIVDIPEGFTDPATALPVQIFIWADSPERAFVEKTSAATLVLLAFLIAMNGLAVWLRRRLERRW